MKTSEATDQLMTALCAAQLEMPDAIFDSTNPHFKSRYASLAAVRKATRCLQAHGIAVVHAKMFTPDGAYVLETRLHHGKSDQWVQSEWPITIGTPQSMGSHNTYGKRYNLSDLTGIATDEDDDGNAAEASVGAAQAGLPEETLPKAKSRAIYDALVKELRTQTDERALTKWGLENSNRIHSMHPDFQRYFHVDYKNRRTAIREGVDEGGSRVQQQLTGSLAKEIDDEIPEEPDAA